MPKSKVRKKKGKKVKYTPKPKGLSKTKMKKLMEMFKQQQELAKANPDTVEIKNSEIIEIPEISAKKIKMTTTDEINQGPSLSDTSEK